MKNIELNYAQASVILIPTAAIKTFYRHSMCYCTVCDKKSTLDESELNDLLGSRR
jgi:hypothetical protein